MIFAIIHIIILASLPLFMLRSHCYHSCLKITTEPARKKNKRPPKNDINETGQRHLLNCKDSFSFIHFSTYVAVNNVQVAIIP